MTDSLAVGVVCPSRQGSWLGGLYYLHHLIRAGSLLAPAERLSFRDVWWCEAPPADDPFGEVRGDMGTSLSLKLPTDLSGRIRRRLGRWLRGRATDDMRDVFLEAGVGVLFPVPPCDRFGIPLVAWITDFQYRHLSSFYLDDQLSAQDAENRRIGALATRLMLSSDDALRDMQRFFPEFVAKTRVVRPCSVPTPDWWQADPAEVARRRGLPERFFLISNQLCRHKNHLTVFRAVRILADRGVRIAIVCTGKKEDYRAPEFFPLLDGELRKLGVEEQVHLTGALPRSEYIALLRRSLCLVQPSQFEGWGFAVSDAKAIGKPMLASDIAVHHEHEAPHIDFLPVHDADAWAEALARAWDELKPGPHPHAEEEAVARGRTDQQRVGGELVALLREAMQTRG